MCFFVFVFGRLIARFGIGQTFQMYSAVCIFFHSNSYLYHFTVVITSYTTIIIIHRKIVLHFVWMLLSRHGNVLIPSLFEGIVFLRSYNRETYSYIMHILTQSEKIFINLFWTKKNARKFIFAIWASARFSRTCSIVNTIEMINFEQYIWYYFILFLWWDGQNHNKLKKKEKIIRLKSKNKHRAEPSHL